jgi:DNA-binding SARP family transcriptional activator/ATP/maltotriose-dependent transcriptional regulator MalT
VAAPSFPVRPRIAGVLAEAWRHRITVVCTEAGYGKSTALASLGVAPGMVTLRLTPQDRDASLLAARIAAAAGLADPVGSVSELVDRFAAAGRDVLVALDEMEHVAASAEAAAWVTQLMQDAPASVHVLLSGRRLPALRLERAEARGLVHRVTAAELAFTVDETAVALGEALAPMAARCQALTGGWPAAVQLAARAWARGDPQAAVAQPDAVLRSAWRSLAEDVVAEQPDREVLGAVAAIGPAEPAVLEAVGVRVVASEWADLHERGLLVGMVGGRLWIAPALSDAAAALVDPEDAAALRRGAAAWWEAADRPAEAMECLAGGDASDLRAFLVRDGHRLAAQGQSARVAELAQRCGPGGPELDAVVADALWQEGDWDGAAAAFERVAYAAADDLSPAVAWRFGALLYLRGDRARAESILAASRADDALSADDALVSAWLGSTLWRNGQVDDAAVLAEVALRQARACADPRALAAAEVSHALVCASRGDRHGNTRAYTNALRAADAAGDTMQAGRIHANLASKAIEEGDYRSAVASANRAIHVAGLHRPIVGLALENKTEALIHLGRLDQARAAAADAVEAYATASSPQVAAPELLLGEVYRLRGDRVQARLAFERALLSGEDTEDVHMRAVACIGLAWVLAGDDTVAAAECGGQALELATGIERAAALNALAWVHLVNGDADRAAELATQAQAEAQRTNDRPALATALEIRGACREPPDLGQLRAALAIWAEVGDPIATARVTLAVATATADLAAAAQARRELADLGAAADVGAAGLLSVADEAADAPSICTLGRFTIAVEGHPVPSGAWQSRKARDLLKLLAARTGRTVTREGAAEALWPDEVTDALGARLSVLLSRLRTVLDPSRRHPPDHYLDADKACIALRPDRVRIDIIDFLSAAADGARLAGAGRWDEAELNLRRAEQLYVGDFLDEDRDADWAVDRREQARTAAVTCARLLARIAVHRGADEDATRWLLRLLERDPYDEDAWTALIATQVRLRRHGEARHHYAAYARRMGELDIVAEPFDKLADRIP